MGSCAPLPWRSLADRFAETVYDLVANGVVPDYSQCCLLLKSTKETLATQNRMSRHYRIEEFQSTTRETNLFVEQEEVLGLIGAILALTDPQNRNVYPQYPADLATMVANCRAEYGRIAAANPILGQYVADANANLAAHPGTFLDATLQELVYYPLVIAAFRHLG